MWKSEVAVEKSRVAVKTTIRSMRLCEREKRHVDEVRRFPRKG
jgi:hypothetical protein